MSLAKEDIRPRQLIESESFKNYIIKHVRFNIKSMYLHRIVTSFSDKHATTVLRYTAECIYQLVFRTKEEDEPLGVATKYDPTQGKKQIKFRKLGKGG